MCHFYAYTVPHALFLASLIQGHLEIHGYMCNIIALYLKDRHLHYK